MSWVFGRNMKENTLPLLISRVLKINMCCEYPEYNKSKRELGISINIPVKIPNPRRTSRKKVTPQEKRSLPWARKSKNPPNMPTARKAGGGKWPPNGQVWQEK